MKHYKTCGLYKTEQDVWDFYSVKEMFEHETNCENWRHCLADAKKYLGQRWHKGEIRYLVNGVPVYKMYQIVGFEDNNAFADYYWILRPEGETDDKKDFFELWNNHDFYKNVIFNKPKKRFVNEKKNKKPFKKTGSVGNKRRPNKVSNN